jgi:hypothetical protein
LIHAQGAKGGFTMFHRLLRGRQPPKPALVLPQNLATWIESQVRAQVPRQQICQQLTAMQAQAAAPLPYKTAANDLMAIMVIRNHVGTKFEMKGRMEEAIEEYEANVRDRYEGAYPYQRLRMIYEQRRDYPNALRVCEAYVRLPGAFVAHHKASFSIAIQQVKNKLGPQEAV